MFENKYTNSVYGIPRFFFYLGLLTIGQTIFRPLFSFTISDWFFLIAFLLTASESLLRGNFPIRFPPLMIYGLLVFSIGGIVSSFYATMPVRSFIALIKYIYLMVVWFWVGTILMCKPKYIQNSIILWTTSAALSGFGALMQVFWDGIIPGTTPSWGRMTGFTEHVNDLGGLTSIALIPAIILIARFQKVNLFSLYFCLISILIASGLVLSVSMSGIFALIISLLVWLFLSSLSIKKIFVLLVSFFLFLSIIVFQIRYEGISVISRLYDISYSGLSSLTLQYRIDTYLDAWEAICDHPFFGVGLGPDVGLTKNGYVVHNLFLLNWFEIRIFRILRDCFYFIFSSIRRL